MDHRCLPPPFSLSPLSPGPRARLWPLRQAQREAAPSTAAPLRTLPVLRDPHQELQPFILWAHPAPWPLPTLPIPGHHRNTGGAAPFQGLGTGQRCAPMAPASALPQPPHSMMGPGSRHLCSTMWSASGKEGSSSLPAALEGGAGLKSGVDTPPPGLWTPSLGGSPGCPLRLMEEAAWMEDEGSVGAWEWESLKGLMPSSSILHPHPNLPPYKRTLASKCLFFSSTGRYGPSRCQRGRPGPSLEP